MGHRCGYSARDEQVQVCLPYFQDDVDESSGHVSRANVRVAFIHWNTFYVSGFQLPLPGQGLSGERLCLGGGPWCREDSCHLLLLGLDEAVAHLIAQILDLGEGQVTLFGVGGQPSPVEFQQHLPQLLQVVLQSL